MNLLYRSAVCFAVALLCLGSARAADDAAPVSSAPAADAAGISGLLPANGSSGVVVAADGTVILPPTWTVAQSFDQLGQIRDTTLLGIRNNMQISFGVRRDRIVRKATLNLDYTPSPSLIPVWSQLRIYLNDTLMQVLTIQKDDLGREVNRAVALNPRLIGDYNNLRIQFIGHYTDICEDPANSTLWLNVAHDSNIVLQEQALDLHNDLAWFPSPFFDPRDNHRLVLPFVFGAAPTVPELRAASILASYFGSLAEWRGVSFPVSFGELPAVPADDVPPYSVVFATNSTMPPFLDDPKRFPPVDAPTVQLIDNPANPYIKILLVRGRDDRDLLTAVRALASGGKLFRGSEVTVNQVVKLTPRHPYDAPNWMPTDRPVRFGELTKYPQQLEADGLRPPPIALDFNLPPDLFVWRNGGVPLHLLYRYTRPTHSGDSNLNIFINDQFLTSLPLESRSGLVEHTKKLTLKLLSADTTRLTQKLDVPALKIGAKNHLRFDFNFAGELGAAQRGYCETRAPVDMRASIDPLSTIDMSGYHHYLAMPDLAAFADSGFPFSRMADLSQTLIVVPKTASPVEVSTLLQAVGGISAAVGYPAFGLRLTDDWTTVAGTDADLLVLGPMPEALRSDPKLPLLLARSRDWLLHAAKDSNAPVSEQLRYVPVDRNAARRVDVSATAPIAAIVGMQSPFHSQRSVVALLATTAADYHLLRNTLGDTGKMAAVSGSVALIRDSGVYSQFVGDQYHVGYLPWWLLIWYDLSGHPFLLALLAIVCVLLLAFLLWRALRWAARRRLDPGA